jgi:hypothetical protein
MKIEAVSRVDYAAYRRYYLFNFLQGKRSPWQARLLLILVPAALAAFLYFYLKNPDDLVNLIGALIMLFLGLVLLFILFVMPHRHYRSVRHELEKPCHYAFYENHMENGAVTPYTMILKAYETQDAFYLYIGPGQAHIIGKNDFRSGSAADLRQILQARLGSRFQH